MMRDRTRRLELGKMLLDVAKYVMTIVVIGGIISGRVQLDMIVLGIGMATGIMGVGFFAIPLEEKQRE